MSTVPEYWQEKGGVLEVEGNLPLILNQGQRAWVVLAGGVDIFWAELKDGQPAGALNHLFRVPAGQLILEFNGPAGEGPGLLAVALPGTRLCQLTLAGLQELSRPPQGAGIIGGLLEKWVSAVSGYLAENRPLPPGSLLLRSRTEVALSQGQAAFPGHHEVLWVSHQIGSSKFLSLEELPSIHAPAFFPLCQFTWLEAEADTRVRAVATAEFMQLDPDWQGLQEFHRLVLAYLPCEHCRFLTAEASSFEAQIQASEDHLAGSFARLASVLEPGEPLARVEGESPLLAACRLVGETLGMAIEAPPAHRYREQHGVDLQEIARVSRFRVRQVKLRGDWWHRDNGPLLGFTAADRTPVALIPASPKTYKLHDPSRRVDIEVTPEVAAGLRPTAYFFYRPFPHQALNALNLVRFSVRGLGKDILTVLLMGAAGGILGLLTPVATGLLFDHIIPGNEREQLFHLTLLLMVFAFASAMFQITRNLATLRIEGKMETTLQAAVWDHLLKLPVPFFRTYSSGDLAIRANAITAIRERLSSTVVTSILSVLFSSFAFALLLYYNWQCALLAAGIILTASLATMVTGSLMLRYQTPQMDLQGQIAGLAFQLFSGIAKLHVAGAEERSFFNWAQLFTGQKRLSYKIRIQANILATIDSALPLIATGVIFYWVTFYQGKEQVSTGDLMAFLAAFAMLISAMMNLSGNLVSILQVAPLYQRARPILEAQPEIDATRQEPPDLVGEIEVSRLCFRYGPQAPIIIEDLSFQVAPGEYVAVVGPTGTGKSTLLRLLLGFEKLESGAIYYDRHDLSGMDVQAVRRQIGVVLQDGQIMPGDILSNIVATSALGEEEAWEAARMAGLEEDIKNLPMGMHTFISEGGVTFSKGQIQRLIIARAIVHKPRILLFDEATSALDNRTQAVVMESLENLQATRIVIAHRLSTIIHADRILVLDQGRLVQSGTYGELINQPGLFAQLANRQLA
jgi:NHLM bacteriocin system ABC transporter ATP-binding protein